MLGRGWLINHLGTSGCSVSDPQWPNKHYHRAIITHHRAWFSHSTFWGLILVYLLDSKQIHNALLASQPLIVEAHPSNNRPGKWWRFIFKNIILRNSYDHNHFQTHDWLLNCYLLPTVSVVKIHSWASPARLPVSGRLQPRLANAVSHVFL